MRNLYFFLISFQLFACTTEKPNTDKTLGQDIQVWWSSELMPGSHKWYTDPPAPEAIAYKLDQQENLDWGESSDSEIISFNIQPDQTHQSLLGIGMALEGTTLYAMQKNKNEQELEEVIKAFIDPETGIGFSMFRLPIGSCDFSDGRSVSDHPQGFYSYQDTPDDEFSIQRDIDLGKVAIIKKVQETAEKLNPSQKLTFFASCWSPPPWMKTSEALIEGTLKPDYERQLAKYFRQFIEAYEAEGIPIHAITIQNEPNYVPSTYPGMLLSPQQEKDIVEATHKEFHENLNGKREINAELWINDHNFEDWENARDVLQGLEAEDKKKYVNAVAFHNYIAGDSVSHMSRLKSMYPEVDMQVTEHSEWGTKGMYNIQQYFYHQSRSYMYWVAMTTRQLDEYNQSPYNSLGELSPTLLIETDPTKPDYYATPEYYLLGQFSRFIRPGALRIGCDFGDKERVTAVAFQNPDGKIVSVFVNQTKKEQAFQVIYEGKVFKDILPAGTVGSYVW